MDERPSTPTRHSSKPCEAAMTLIIYSILQRLRKSITQDCQASQWQSLGLESGLSASRVHSQRCFSLPRCDVAVTGYFA